jgi:hypothetical protein
MIRGGMEQDEECAICLEPLFSQQTHQTPCQHVFHEDCYDGWRAVSDACPCCRSALPPAAHATASTATTCTHMVLHIQANDEDMLIQLAEDVDAHSLQRQLACLGQALGVLSWITLFVVITNAVVSRLGDFAEP